MGTTQTYIAVLLVGLNLKPDLYLEDAFTQGNMVYIYIFTLPSINLRDPPVVLANTNVLLLLSDV